MYAFTTGNPCLGAKLPGFSREKFGGSKGVQDMSVL